MSTFTISGESGYDTGSLPEIVPQNTWQLNDTLFYTHDAHLLRFGFSVIQNRFGFFQLASPSGALDYSRIYTTSPSGSGGAGLADFLFGLPDSAGKSALPLGTPYERYSEYGAFVQDQWHATTRFTLSLGLRYDLFTPVSERHNRQSDFLFKSGALVSTGRNGVSSSILGLQMHDFSPRIGLAYRVGDRTVIRAAYGLFYFNEQGTGGSTRLFINFPFAAQYTVTCSSTVPCMKTSVGIPPASSANSLPTVVYQPLANLTPNLQQWHLTAEHQLSSSMVVCAAYVGTHGNHPNLNTDENVAIPGPGPATPRQPFPAFGIISGWEPRGFSNYDALQLSAEKRYSRGLSFLAAYTWSKSLDEGNGGNSSTGDPRINIQNPRNLRANYGLSSFDYRHRFTFSAVAELPVGHGRKFMHNARPLAETVTGGWQMTSTSLRSQAHRSRCSSRPRPPTPEPSRAPTVFATAICQPISRASTIGSTLGVS